MEESAGDSQQRPVTDEDENGEMELAEVNFMDTNLRPLILKSDFSLFMVERKLLNFDGELK